MARATNAKTAAGRRGVARQRCRRVVPKLTQGRLELGRCPHCGIDVPNLSQYGHHSLTATNNPNKLWAVYGCNRCAGIVVAYARIWDDEIRELWPKPIEISEHLPERAREYLRQAINSKSSPVGCVMLAASAVDAMLKAKGLSDGTLFARIGQAARDHLITDEMARWADQIRLDANDQRHADEQASLPTTEDAAGTIEFVQALAQFMFILPARVKRGLEVAGSSSA
jgi:hypothetical protein